jgi:acetyl esterase/lipase
VKRRTIIKGLAAAPLIPVIGGSLTGRAAASTASSLVFDPADYTVETMTVTTDSSGTTVDVTYHFYEGIPYVANPVDVTYQSLDISVPVEIGGVTVDATRAPILFNINVGGYTSSPIATSLGSTGGVTGGGGPPGGPAPTGTGTNYDNGGLALAAGFVRVDPACRGWDNETSAGTYFGKAPAAIVDLKAAVRYLRSNQGLIPGDTEHIVSTGGSAGGALSSLLAASGDQPEYQPYLDALGAAHASDAIFAAFATSPITDLDHGDMQYEWELASLPLAGGDYVDSTWSGELVGQFTRYQDSLRLNGINGWGPLRADNYADYLLRNYLIPSATYQFSTWTSDYLEEYLADNTWISYSDERVSFTWDGYLGHIGTRQKTCPAFDTIDLSAPENHEFGDATVNARHFTLWGLRRATGDDTAQLDPDLPPKIYLMNALDQIVRNNPNRARHWWIRNGTLDTNAAHTVSTNIAAALTDLGDDVNSAFYWDGGHAVDWDGPEFIDWITRITGHRRPGR